MVYWFAFGTDDREVCRSNQACCTYGESQAVVDLMISTSCRYYIF